jgi:hypothetical protein
LTASPDAPTDLDRLIEALEPRPEPDAVVFFQLEGGEGKALLIEVKRFEHAEAEQQLTAEVGQSAVDAYTAALEQQEAARARENAVRALARAALERLMNESVIEVMGLLEKAIEEMDESRKRAAQVEGEREPDDPYVILQALPDEYREWFLADYRRALRDAYPAEGFLALRRMLRQWHKRAEWYSDPAYQERMRASGPPQSSRPWAELREELRAQGRLR